MASILLWIRKRFSNIKDSFSLIVKGLFLCMIALSGFNFAIILRILEYKGLIISLYGILIQFFSMIIAYFIFRKYFSPEQKEVEETYK